MGQALGCQSPQRHNKSGKHLPASPYFPEKAYAVTTERSGTKTTVWGVDGRSGLGVVRAGRVLAWAAQVEPARADMDRFGVCRRTPEEIFVFGVYDGHGIAGRLNWGATIAQSAARKVGEGCSRPFSGGNDRQASMKDVFLEFQSRHEERYDREVASKVDSERSKFQAKNGFSAGARTLPAEGGTTATVLRVDGDVLSVAWVGDSRAVLGRRSGEALPLTVDHNISSHPEERARCERAGGHVLGRFLGTGEAEGMLQVTRSLGDRAHHLGNVVGAEPDYFEHELDDDDLFLLAASDGLWDHISNQDAVDLLCAELKGERGEQRKRAEDPALDDAGAAKENKDTDDTDDDTDDKVVQAKLKRAVQALVRKAAETRASNETKPDDCTCLLVLFRPLQRHQLTAACEDPAPPAL
mmetsp:Transcript_763/g.2596  ORF Transcript_763/g.2596 Transcript_763/m.2596 type:complete len:411 (+) Transcript_763:26-1258(+)